MKKTYLLIAFITMSFFVTHAQDWMNKYNSVYDFSEGLAGVETNDKWGFVNKSGKEVIPCKYDDVYDFSEGLAGVKMNGKWGFVNKSGKEVILVV